MSASFVTGRGRRTTYKKELPSTETASMSHQPDSAAPNDIPLHRPDDSGWSIVEQSGFLRGVSFNGPNGPYKCSRQVFRVQDDAVYSVQACQDISNEELYPANEVDAAYIHMGWPVPSALPARPWDVMYQQPKATSGQGNWVSRRMVIHKWTVSLRKEDLVPVEAFINEVEEALKESGVADQMEALRGVFAAWGEMIALAAVIGCSLAATGTLGSKQTLTGDSATFRPPDRGPDLMQMIDHSLDITGNFERRFESRIQGGYPETFSNSGFNAWLTDASKIDNYSTWEVVKVNHAVPITDLLPKSLRQKVTRLFSYSNMIFRSPAVGSKIAFGFDGASLGVKDIKQINVWHNGAVMQDISIVYTDGSAAGPYGFGTVPTNLMSDSFVLARGEFITDVFVWATSASINAMQFAKNTSQLSVRYGIQNGAGDPSIFTAGGNALLGLSGSFNAAYLTQIQVSIIC
ncbi:hypothetical protein RSAG8_12125, partial [Rhizoctonia solani AG-8 WAC10335]